MLAASTTKRVSCGLVVEGVARLEQQCEGAEGGRSGDDQDCEVQFKRCGRLMSPFAVAAAHSTLRDGVQWDRRGCRARAGDGGLAAG